MQGDDISKGYDCFFKIKNSKELYTKEAGYCKLAPDAKKDTSQFSGVEATTVNDC